MSAPRILVLGAGPAGAAVALGLRRLGYPLRVVSDWRRFAALEGVSQRALDGLRQAGLHRALACATLASPRRVQWNGEEQRLNQEFLIDRAAFDAALREDLREAGVELLAARVRAVESGAEGHRVQLESGETLHGEFLVEARGRQAPLAGRRQRGPETLSLLSQWQQASGPAASAVQSLADGWAWQLAAAIHWLIEQDVVLINLSLGLRQDRPLLRQACAAASAAGILLCASSPAQGAAVFPAAYPQVLRITGDARCAPGQWSWLDSAQADFGAPVRADSGMAGASVACAALSGLIAAFLHREPGAGREAVLDYLHRGAAFIGPERRGAGP